MAELTSNRKAILVAGATGKQGRAFISSIIAGTTNQRFRILALTRSPSSPAARSLLSQSAGSDSEIELVKGDLDDPESLRTVFKNAQGGIWGVFVVLAFPGLGVSSEGEEKQGHTIADLSLEFGVSHFVYSGAERGADPSDEELKDVHGMVKVRIERHVMALGNRGLIWTILRPGFFMENFDGMIGKITVGITQLGLQPQTKLHLIAVEDIGHVAASVFQNPEKYAGKILPVVGDVLTAKEQDEACRRATGNPLPSVPTPIARLLLTLNSHTRNIIADMERVCRERSAMEGGVEQVARDTKEIYPDVMTLEQWARKRDPRSSEKTRPKGWNHVTLMSLFRGKQ